MVFLVVVSIGMMELMTSLFIDSLMQEKKRMEQRQSAQMVEKRKVVENLMAGLFRNFDKDSNGSLDKVELEHCMRVFEEPATNELMDHVGINSSMLVEAISVADLNADGTVTEQEFRESLESISAPPMKSDLRAVHQGVNLLRKEFKSIAVEVKGMREDMRAILERLPPN